MALSGKYRIIVYGVALAALLLLLNWMEYRLLIIDQALNIYISAIAVLFTGLGIWLALKLSRPKKETIIIEKEVFIPAPADFTPNETAIANLGLSKRELEVLQLMASGLSNAQIADTLFVSVNTIKTHTSKLFEKLEVSRRTQAVETARRLGVIQ